MSESAESLSNLVLACVLSVCIAQLARVPQQWLRGLAR